MLHERYELPVYPIAPLSYRRPKRLQPDVYTLEFPRFQVLRFQFQVIQLNRLDWQAYRNLVNPVATALMSRMSMRTEERPMARLACLRMTARLSPRLPPSTIKTICGFIDQYLALKEQEELTYQKELAKVSPRDREVIMEFTTSWEKKGIQQGKAEGARHSLLTVLKHRFGPPSKTLRRKVDKIAREEVILGLIEVALQCDSVEDFTPLVDAALEQPAV